MDEEMQTAVILYWNGYAQWGSPEAISIYALQAFENGEGFCMSLMLSYDEGRQFMMENLSINENN